jgi:3-phosphoshikimate 1-carboxyvinyltransferase
MALPDLLLIPPFTRPVCGSVVLPGSKSLTNRALLLAALCDGPVTLTGALFSEDTEIMVAALKTLGFVVKPSAEKNEIYVEGRGGKIPAGKATVHVGLAGTAARFLTALCAAAPRGAYQIDGVHQMRKRPMKGLFDALERQGSEIEYLGEKGFFPIELHAHGLRGGPVEIDASESSQMLSALLMVAPLAEKEDMAIMTVGGVRQPFVIMTMNLMLRFGHPSFSSAESPNQIHISRRPYRQPTRTFHIEGDATAASYFIALPLVTPVGGKIRIDDYNLIHPCQGDVRFSRLLETSDLIAQLNYESSSQVFKAGSCKQGILSADFREFSDTFLTLAAIAPLLDGPTSITGIAHTRKQETDRVAGMARELKKLGQDVHEHEDGDGLTITPRPLKPGVEIETYGDHRFAMSFAILGCHDLLGNGQPWLTIKNPACCAKTFPHFFDELARLHTASHNVAS